MINKRLFSASVCAGLLSIMIGCNALASAGSTSSSQSVVNGVIVKSISDNAISDKAISDNAEEPDAAGALNAGEAVETVAAVIENSGVSVMAASTEVSDNSSDNSSDSSPDNSPDSSPNNSSDSGSALDTSKLFTDRDLEQKADTTGARPITVADSKVYTVKNAGVYVISGTASNAQICVEAGEEDKVQLVLDGVKITNDSIPCIYVKKADKVFVTTTDSENALSVTGTFKADGETNTDAVIFSRDDLVLNGTGTLNVSSTDNGISSKDDLKITGGTLAITCASDALEANDSVVMADGTVTIQSNKDGIHAENDEDDLKGYVYIGGGTLNIAAADDAIHATTIAQVDNGTITLSCAEGLEGTWIQINGGKTTIDASDDGINAGRKSSFRTPLVEINGGELTITMGAGDTDAVDSNGDLIITGGTIDLTAQSPFDYDGTVQKTGGTIIVNGTETDSITNQMMGGHGGGKGGFKHGGFNRGGFDQGGFDQDNGQGGF